MSIHQDVETYFDNVISHNAFVTLVKSEPISWGASRVVYPHRWNDKLVVKIEITAKTFQNIHEYELWDQLSYTKIGKRWLAPVYFISPDGKVLVQARCKPAEKSELPKKVPNWLTDLKVTNFGWYKKRIVCHDYGVNLAIAKGTKNRLVKADWWTE